jgi:hypothetical protein
MTQGEAIHSSSLDYIVSLHAPPLSCGRFPCSICPLNHLFLNADTLYQHIEGLNT